MGTENIRPSRRDVDAIRKRAGMYIGDTGRYGLAHLVYFAIDVTCSALAAPPTRLEVKLRKNGSLAVRSDVEHPRASALVQVLEEGSFDPASLVDDDSLWEILALAALASEFRLSTRSHEAGVSWAGSRGVRKDALRKIPGGTPRIEIVFAPDREIFREHKIGFDAVVTRLQEIAPLFPRLEVNGIDEGSGAEFAATYPDGLATLVSWSAGLRTLIPKPIVVDAKWNDLRIRAALQWVYPNEYARSVMSYVNTVRTRGGGSHERGLIRAVKAAKSRAFAGTTDGLIAAIAVDGPRRSLHFKGPTRDVLSVDGLEEAVLLRVRQAITESFASA